MSELMNDVDAIYRFIKRIVKWILYAIGILLILTLVGVLIASPEGSDRNRVDDGAEVAVSRLDIEPRR